MFIVGQPSLHLKELYVESAVQVAHTVVGCGEAHPLAQVVDHLK